MKADLHIHSVFSDGSDSRESILQKAAAVGINVLAFTEHDTTEGWQESLALGRRYGITVLPGVEISACDAETGKKVHILGYGFKNIFMGIGQNVCFRYFIPKLLQHFYFLQ